MNHLIHMLVKGMLPSYEDCHKWQMLGMQGPDLAKKCQKQIVTCAPEIPLKQIKEIGQLRFEIQSSSSEIFYEINILMHTCTCINFPHIQLCKHLMATVHYFQGGLEGAEFGPQAPDNASEPDMPKSSTQQDGSTGNSNSRAAVILAANDIIRIAQEIITKAPANPEMAKSLKLA